MKRLIATILFALLLCGCSVNADQDANTVTFYYCAAAEQFDSQTGVLSGESVKIDGSESLEALLTQYLKGPAKENFVSPFPAGTELLELSTDGDTTIVTLSRNFLSLTGIDRSVACACLAETVFELTGSQAVTILSGESTSPNKLHLTISADAIKLIDDTTIPQEG